MGIGFVDGKEILEYSNRKGFTVKVLKNGSVHSITDHNIMINLLLGSPIEGSSANIYVRITGDGRIAYFPITGPESESRFYYNSQSVVWKGERLGIAYDCCLKLDDSGNIIFWQIDLKNITAGDVHADIVFSQDIGIADGNAVRTNEAYTSQYIDHKVYGHSECGYVILSRQNQPQAGKHPWVMIGALNKIKGYLTDGFQYFGLSYKESNRPEVLGRQDLPNVISQYEFAYPALQTEKVCLGNNERKSFTFYLLYEEDHSAKTSEEDLEKIKIVRLIAERHKKEFVLKDYKENRVEKNIFNNVNVFAAEELTKSDIQKYFSGEIRNSELIDNKQASFFYGNGYHVVLKLKEMKMERPHGHIIRSYVNTISYNDNMSTTAYMYGLFNSHLTIGNTSFNKILSISRNPLNVYKTSGQRIFAKLDGKFVLLGVPSAFEMGTNHCRWIYKGNDKIIIVKVYLSPDNPACFTEIQVESKEKIEFLITNDIVMGEHENTYKPHITIDQENKRVEMVPSPKSLMGLNYPQSIAYIIMRDRKSVDFIDFDGDRSQGMLLRNDSLVLIKTKPVSDFKLMITGSVESQGKARLILDKYENYDFTFEDFMKNSRVYWKRMTNSIQFKSDGNKNIADKLNDILLWYSHNAMVHYITPHGLEQYTGAAWGVRDICQGAVEYFIPTQNYELIKDILKMVYSHQYDGIGNWPQWFMFDRYYGIQQNESHGDVIVWPLKAVCDYIEATNDFSILNEEVSFTNVKGFKFTKKKETILDHIRLQINYILDNLIEGTSLICYGEGDWDDTLQPADGTMKERMVSSWTVGLLYQTLGRFKEVCVRGGKQACIEGIALIAEDIEDLQKKMKKDFENYLIKDGVIAGFIYFHENGGYEPIIHPLDKKTNIQYRLLPMTQGIISGMFSREQALKHYGIIEKELLFPDGVRLMNKPAKYDGGIQKYFKRAETASNFGREIGLMYVHAHIRHIESLAKLGKAEEAFEALMVINPINIQSYVKNAGIRQSNSYFSSSDAAFNNRYEVEKDFALVKEGNIDVKGGWRIYSSGPGIYINTLVSYILGIRYYYDKLVIDPVLAKGLDGFEYHSRLYNKDVVFRFIVREEGFHPKKLMLNGSVISDVQYIPNPYRKGGALIDRDMCERLLGQAENQFEIYL